MKITDDKGVQYGYTIMDTVDSFNTTGPFSKTSRVLYEFEI